MKLLIDSNMDCKKHGLNGNEAGVLAAIVKCTNCNKGWFGTMQALADYIPFAINRTTVSRTVTKLINLGLVENVQNALFAVQIALPPNNPLIYNNKMERNENIACAHLRTAKSPLPASFEKLVKVYTLRVGNHKMDDKARDNCLRAWTSQKYPEWKQDMLIEAIERGAEDICKPTLEWTLDRFDPQPTNYNHRELETGVKYYTARWDGKWGTYAEEDVKRFNLEIAPQPKKSNKQI